MRPLLISQAARASRAGWIAPYVRLMRPQQWTKNAIVLAGVVFSGRIDNAGAVLDALSALIAFCLASSAVYAFNDWHDREEDRLHPIKCWRPIAARQVPPAAGLAMANVLFGVALLVAASVSLSLAAVVLAYGVLMAAYTVWLRQVAIVDLAAIAGGFIMRAWAGAVAVEVPLSNWLFLCTLLLALFLGLGKRRHEVRMLRGELKRVRPSLAGYTRIDLDRVIVAVAGITVAAYIAYTFSVPSYGRSLPMVVTVPFVVVGLGRYLYLMLKRNLGGSPELVLLRDRFLLLAILLWAIAVGLVLAS